MNIFKRIYRWFKTRKNLKFLSQVSSIYGTLEKLEKSGIIKFDRKRKRLFIEYTLAQFYMQSEQKWRSFIQNVFNWQYLKMANEAYGKFLMKEELQALHDWRKSHNGSIGKSDAVRIRQARRDEILQSDMPEVKPEGFEIYVVKASAKPTKQKEPGAPLGEIVVVGTYDYESDKLEMTSWQEVQSRL